MTKRIKARPKTAPKRQSTKNAAANPQNDNAKAKALPMTLYAVPPGDEGELAPVWDHARVAGYHRLRRRNELTRLLNTHRSDEVNIAEAEALQAEDLTLRLQACITSPYHEIDPKGAGPTIGDCITWALRGTHGHGSCRGEFVSSSLRMIRTELEVVRDGFEAMLGPQRPSQARRLLRLLEASVARLVVVEELKGDFEKAEICGERDYEALEAKIEAFAAKHQKGEVRS